MKTILGFFLLLIWLPSNLGAILPQFDLKVLLLICYFKMIRNVGGVRPLVLRVQLLPARYNPKLHVPRNHLEYDEDSHQHSWLRTLVFLSSLIS